MVVNSTISTDLIGSKLHFLSHSVLYQHLATNTPAVVGMTGVLVIHTCQVLEKAISATFGLPGMLGLRA